MRKLTLEECKKVGGGKTDWDEWAKYNGYGNMPNPPNSSDMYNAAREGALMGFFLAGPAGAIEGAMVGAGGYMIFNSGYNIYKYYF